MFVNQTQKYRSWCFMKGKIRLAMMDRSYKGLKGRLSDILILLAPSLDKIDLNTLMEKWIVMSGWDSVNRNRGT
jgi:hypothetical protein